MKKETVHMFKKIRWHILGAVTGMKHQIKNQATGDVIYPVRPPAQNIAPGQNTFSL